MLPPTQDINSSSAAHANANWNLATGQNVPTRSIKRVSRQRLQQGLNISSGI